MKFLHSRSLRFQERRQRINKSLMSQMAISDIKKNNAGQERESDEAGRDLNQMVRKGHLSRGLERMEQAVQFL